MIRTRVIGMANGVLLALVGLSCCGASSRAAETAPDLAGQQQRQRLIQADTDRLVRRVHTMIRVLEYNRLDRSAEKEMLDQVAGTLAGLSREQMVRLIDALERAGKTEGEARTRELMQVQERHEQIVLGLKGLLARFDAIKGLDQAAERLDKLARDELDHYLQNAQLIWENERATNAEQGQEFRLRAERLAGEEVFLHRDLGNLLAQAGALRPLLPPEQQERLRQVEATLKSSNVLDNLMTASRQLRSAGTATERRVRWRRAAEMQWLTSGDIQELARILRGPGERLASLREARQKLERVIDDQEGVREGTQTPPEKEKPDVRPEEMPELNLQWARGLSSRQASLEFDTRATRALLDPYEPQLAGHLRPIEKSMRQAHAALRNQATRRPPIARATDPQEAALEKLHAVKDELDRLITEAEKAQADPLANLKDTLAKVEQIIKEQKDVRDKADEAGKTAQPQRLPYLTPKQEDLAKRTEELPAPPTAAAPATRKALDDAAKAMDQASKALQSKQASPTVQKQDEALGKLEEAKKALAEQVAEIEKRREDIAQLEAAQQRLAKMIQQENKVAAEAHDKETKSEPNDARDLAKKQGELTPQAKELDRELQKSAPEAAKQVAEGARQMDAAKENLDKKQIPPAAKNADQAVDKLKEAQKAVAKALDQKRGKEAAEQAAMRKEVDPENVAQQIAKALERTEQAARDSEQAAKQLGEKPQSEPSDLAKLQKDVSKQADKVEAPAAKQPARQAAEALQKGDLQEALTQQKQALAQLRDAAQKKGQEADESPKAAPKPSEAKNAGELAQAQKALMERTEQAAKASEQTARDAEQAAKRLAEKEASAPPDLVKLQQDVSKQSEKVEAPAAKQPAGEAAEALQKGDLQEALAQQKRALVQLQEVARKKGQSAEESPGRVPEPSEARNAAELAQAQKALIEATKALAQSQAANQAAMAALAQAQAQAPGVVQPQLQKAGQQLSQASRNLQQGEANPANQAQGQAAAQLKQALDALNSAMAQAGDKGEGQKEGQGKGEGQGQKPSEGKGQAQGKGQGQKPSQGKGKEPGQGKSQQPGRSREKNEGRGSGYRIADGQMNNTPPHKGDVRGEGMFIHLPPRQRELIKQALSDKLPPEYAALIQQYYVNIAKGKPATMTPEKTKP